jgi:hypothetical protein
MFERTTTTVAHPSRRALRALLRVRSGVVGPELIIQFATVGA